MNLRTAFRRLLRPLRRMFDGWIASPWFLNYLAGALDRSPRTQSGLAAFEGSGHLLLRRQFYLPIPDDKDIGFIKESELVGVEIDEERCFGFHEKHVQPYDAEFRGLPRTATNCPLDYSLSNGTFMAVDGNMYYGLIRSLAPGRIIEVGAGNSTKLASVAIQRNAADGRRKSELICIEPFHSATLDELPAVTRIVRSYVQEVDLDLFESLGEGDILFIDSTHTVREGGDVWWEICEILPRLKSGVLVHIHDVSLPKPYSREYRSNQWYWMEQYMLQAFLTFNSRYTVVWPGNLLLHRHRQRMTSLFKEELDAMCSAYPSAEPASFWMRVN